MQAKDWLQTPILVALIAGLASLLVSCLTAFFSYRAKTRESELSDLSAERNARRDYEYEARKRLYQECEPLLFELYQLSIGGMKRVGSLARSARKGYLDNVTHGWLAVDDYYTLSTVYKLMAPLAIVRIIQRRITLVDLTLDARIREQFSLANCLYSTFTADFKLANSKPDLEYDPNAEFDRKIDICEGRKNQPAKYCRQGLSVGRLETAVDALIVTDKKGALRCKSFGRFESEYKDEKSSLHSEFAQVVELFLNFHPRTRPILWRVLITQLHLYRTIIFNSENRLSDTTTSGNGFVRLSSRERKRYDWRKQPTDASEEKVLVEPFAVAERYLTKRLARNFAAE